jgi:hypothetical protein
VPQRGVKSSDKRWARGRSASTGRSPAGLRMDVT